jgi:hypothetical protein
MAAETHHDISLDENFVFSPILKKNIFIILGIGVLLFIIGLVLLIMGGSHDEHHAATSSANDLLASVSGGVEHAEGAHEGGHHGSPSWLQRLYANLWINNVFFTGISLVGVFFFAIQYAASAGWSSGIIRVMIGMSRFLPYAFVLMLVVFLLANHDLFHWTHQYLFDKNSPEYDEVIDGKKGFLNIPFYLTRMVFFFSVWLFFSWALRKESAREDLEGGTKIYRKLVKMSAVFLIFFAVSSSISAWDWVMSIDTHWYSTMFGWYVFASWFVSGLSAITLFVIVLNEMGYLKFITESHLHDLGKFVFAFSIFWTYIWFSQFLLIYYANIPEETVYFWERLSSDNYAKFVFINLILNFFFPFLGLMTRDAKRKTTILKLVCTVVLVGHWLDFYLMITPGTLKAAGGFGFLEIGLAMIYLAGFLLVVFQGFTKGNLIPKNHPMIQECLHHSV